MIKVKFNCKTPFYAVRVPRDRIGVTAKHSWNYLNPYGSLPTKAWERPLWKKQLANQKLRKVNRKQVQR